MFLLACGSHCNTCSTAGKGKCNTGGCADGYTTVKTGVADDNICKRMYTIEQNY